MTDLNNDIHLTVLRGVILMNVALPEGFESTTLGPEDQAIYVHYVYY